MSAGAQGLVPQHSTRMVHHAPALGELCTLQYIVMFATKPCGLGEGTAGQYTSSFVFFQCLSWVPTCALCALQVGYLRGCGVLRHAGCPCAGWCWALVCLFAAFTVTL